jgi:hypothetical protein
MLLEAGAQAGDDLDRILDRRLVDVDLLEAPEQRRSFSKWLRNSL